MIVLNNTQYHITFRIYKNNQKKPKKKSTLISLTSGMYFLVETITSDIVKKKLTKVSKFHTFFKF